MEGRVTELFGARALGLGAGALGLGALTLGLLGLRRRSLDVVDGGRKIVLVPGVPDARLSFTGGVEGGEAGAGGVLYERHDGEGGDEDGGGAVVRQGGERAEAEA